MEVNFIKLSLGFFLLVSPSVFFLSECISISSDEWTGSRKYNKHQITKRQNSGSDSSASTNSHTDSTASSEENDELWYNEQCIDHDGDCSQKSNQWSQRYWTSAKHYQPGGPIFMLLGGESPISTWVRGGAWHHYAKNYNATTLVVEHRFYGQSFPTPKIYRSAGAMKILTIQQALEDYAKLLSWFKSEKHKHLKDAKVVVFGGSYPGFLAAWFRAQYPKLVNVAVASSAPLNYTLEFPEFTGTVSKILQQENNACFRRIKSAFTCMQGIINGTGCSRSNVTLENLSRKTHYCGSLKTDIEKDSFFTTIGRSIWASNRPGTSTLLPANKRNKSLCDIILQQKHSDIVKRYGKFIYETNNSQCNRRRKRQVPQSDIGGYRFSWNWQTLTEFVNLQVADPILGMLGVNWGRKREIQYYSSYYPNAGFDENRLIESVAKTKELYPMDFWKNNASCTIFTYGSWDPWATKGITSESDVSEKNTVYFIPKGEHMDDFFHPPVNPFANSSISRTQNKVMKKIGTYLHNSEC